MCAARRPSPRGSPFGDRPPDDGIQVTKDALLPRSARIDLGDRLHPLLLDESSDTVGLGHRSPRGHLHRGGDHVAVDLGHEGELDNPAADDPHGQDQHGYRGRQRHVAPLQAKA